ncbi:MAG: transglutaminase family protein [Thermoleophilia bacterium]
MGAAWKTAHLAAFAALATVTVLTVDRVVEPPMTRALLIALALGLAAGLPGYLNDWVLPSSLVLIPVGLYVLMRVVLPLPPDVERLTDQPAFYFQELRGGFRAYTEDIFPLSLGAVSGLRLLVAVWVYLLVVLSTLLALGAGRPVLGAAVLSILLGFTTTVDQRPGLVHGALFLALLILTLTTSEATRRRGWRPRDALGGLAAGAAAIALAFLVMMAVPGLTQPGWADWRTWDPFNGGHGTTFVFNWKQNYPRLLDPGNAVPVMRVTSPVPSYWRATTLEFFSGDTWLSDGAFRTPLPEGPGPRAIQVGDPEPPGSLVEQRFELSSTTTNYLFTGGRPRTLTLDSDTVVYASDSASLRTATMLASPLQYSMTAVVPRVSPDQLVGTSTDYPENIRGRYLDLPFPDAATALQMREQAGGPGAGDADASPPPEVLASSPRGDEFAKIYALNRLVVGDATDPYDVTLRVERYLRTHYRYSLEVPPSSYASPIAAFLFGEGVGYCQHFAGALAVLLRLNGIPSRVAVGFTTGEQVGAWSYLVTTNNAHAWVEAYFSGIGWLPFDATPGRTLPLPGPSSASPGFVDPFQHATPGDTAGPDSPLPDATGRLPEDVETAGGRTGSAGIPVLKGLAAPAALAVLILAWPWLLRRVRERGVRHGRPESRLRASIGLLRAELAVAGADIVPSATLDQAADSARECLGLEIGPMARRAQEVLFGGREAHGGDVRLAERTRRAVRRLAWRRRRAHALAAWYGVTPALVWWRRQRSPDGPAAEPQRHGATWRLRP